MNKEQKRIIAFLVENKDLILKVVKGAGKC